ncbi:Hypothetical protein CINCED_3A014962 [Cinara cedri]|uniref:Epithelial sodium channel n=1 Tax=Cinara cedri TaxID=506608 RepID=A0A5E4N4V8_9HEMI|nr:Hypothetical protein CINCED_3A014962 [Cinara cedri]
MEGEVKSKFTIAALFTHVLKQSSLGNKFWTKNKYSSLYWICVSIGSFALGVFLSRDIVFKWYESPVNRFMINKPRHLSENPFPAITICHHDPINSNTMNLASVLGWTRENKTDEEQEALQIGKKWSSLTSDWNPDQGYGHNANVPWRINSTGFWNSVEIVLEQSDSYYGCSSKQGFTVYFHSPADVPDYSHDSIKFSKSTHSFVQITTHVTLTDDSIKSWEPEKRGCYYSNEKRLKYNTIYTYTNCYVECQLNNTESLCGCVPMYRINSSFPVCGPNLHNCQASAASKIFNNF